MNTPAIDLKAYKKHLKKTYATGVVWEKLCTLTQTSFNALRKYFTPSSIDLMNQFEERLSERLVWAWQIYHPDTSTEEYTQFMDTHYPHLLKAHPDLPTHR